MKAPEFSLPDQNGEIHTLSRHRGKWLILYFYPKDDTPGCTKEACAFRDTAEQFRGMGAEVIGVSKDGVASHKKFSDKYKLNFTLLSDVGKDLIKAYGSWGEKKFMGKTFMGVFRNTYLINPEGDIVKAYEKVNPLIHSRQVLADLTSLQLSER